MNPIILAVEMAAEGIASLKRPDVGFNLVFLRTGLSSFRPSSHAGSAGRGTLVVLVAENVDITTPLRTEPWGQRFFQVQDPNGIVYELTHWVSEPR